MSMSSSHIIIDPHHQLQAIPGANTYILQPDSDSGQAKTIPIKKVRELIDWSQKTAFLDQPRVIIILCAHMMNSASQNTLLKTLEEPSQDTTIILTVTQESDLLPTIRSRCTTVSISQIDPQKLNRWSLKVTPQDITTNHSNLPTLTDFLQLTPWQQLDLMSGHSKKSVELNQLIDNWITEITRAKQHPSLSKQQSIHLLKHLHLSQERLKANCQPRLVANQLHINFIKLPKQP